MRGQSRTSIAQKEPAHGYQWNREGHPYAIPREQAQVESKDRRAKTEYQTDPGGVGSPPSFARNEELCQSYDDEFHSQIFRDHDLSKSIRSILVNSVMLLALQYREHQ